MSSLDSGCTPGTRRPGRRRAGMLATLELPRRPHCAQSRWLNLAPSDATPSRALRRPSKTELQACRKDTEGFARGAPFSAWKLADSRVYAPGREHPVSAFCVFRKRRNNLRCSVTWREFSFFQRSAAGPTLGPISRPNSRALRLTDPVGFTASLGSDPESNGSATDWPLMSACRSGTSTWNLRLATGEFRAHNC